MKFGYFLILAALGLMACGCSKKDNDELAHHHEHGHEHAHEGEHHHHDGDEDGDGDDVIKLSPEMAGRFGLTTDTVAPRRMSAIVKAGATVEASNEATAVASAPTSGIVTISPGLETGSRVSRGAVIATVRADGMTGGDANRVSKVELDAAKAELDRVEALYADRLVTLAEYNAAKTAYEKARASYSSAAASGKAVSPIAGVIVAFDAATGQYVEAGAPIASIAASGRIIVRAEVPVTKYRQIAASTDARVALADGTTLLLSDLDGRRLDAGVASASAGGYVPVTYSVRNDGTLIPGQALTAYILGPEERQALAVPTKALSEQQGAYFVYQRLDEDCYRRLPVTVGVSDGQYTEILSGLTGGEAIVADGVLAVRLAQTSGAVPEGHTHSH